MISIIIIVKNDPKIETLLSAIDSLNMLEQIEVIVVDASKGGLDAIRSKFASVIWLPYDQKNKKRTYAQQRNIGIKYAKGSIIVFIDSDCIPDKNWLSNLTRPIKAENEEIVSGACRPLGNDYIHKGEKYGKYRDECETMNMAISKSVIAKVGLFDENLEGCEDSDFCIRARELQFKIRNEPSAIIYHDWGGFRKNITRSYTGGKDRYNFYRKHKEQLFFFSINTIYTFYYIFYVLFIPIAFFYPLYLLIIFIPSVIKMRNPLKELFNLVFTIGFLMEFVKAIFGFKRSQRV